MKFDKYLGFTEGEITVYCGNHAGENVLGSLRQASKISKSKRRGNILYINTIYTTRRLFESARKELANPVKEKLGEQEGIFFKNIIVGDLAKYLGELREMIEEHDIKHIIINSWDLANRSYGYKEKVLFGLMGFTRELGVSVLIYSQAKMTNAVPGEMHRGGLGKLAAIADDIIFIRIDPDQQEKKAESKILSPMKINELEYAQSETSISEHGELHNPSDEGGDEVLEQEMELVM